jgi:hypothetical protein
LTDAAKAKVIAAAAATGNMVRHLSILEGPVWSEEVRSDSRARSAAKACATRAVNAGEGAESVSTARRKLRRNA